MFALPPKTRCSPPKLPQPKTLRPDITVSSLVFCVTVLYGQHTQGLDAFWARDVGAVCLAGAVAAVAVLLTSALVLPSVASEEVRACGYWAEAFTVVVWALWSGLGGLLSRAQGCSLGVETLRLPRFEARVSKLFIYG